MKRCSGDWCSIHGDDHAGRERRPAFLRGTGIYSDAKNAVKKGIKKLVAPIAKRIEAVKKGPRTAASNRFQKFLDEHPEKITKIQLGRMPIQNYVHKALDVMSAGRFSKKQKDLDYDQVYHNYLLVTLDDGKTYKLEKNETVVEHTAEASDYKNQTWDIPLQGKQLTMKNMVQAASAGNESRFYKYRGDSDNCQRFTRDMVEKNGLLPDENHTSHKHLEVQDAKKLTGTLLPGVNKLPNALTDLASIADRAVYGDGLKAKAAIRAALFR
jgi:hypothetical protein